MEKLLQRVDKCLIRYNEQLSLIKKNKGVDGMPSIAKKEAFEKKVQKAFVQLLSKDKHNAEPGDQCLQKEVKKLKRLNLSWI